MNKKKRILYGVILIIIILMVCAFYNGLVVKRYTVLTNKIEEGKSIRIILIADLHSHIYGKNQNDLISMIKRQNPDLIMLAGDIADDMTPIKGTELLLEGIQGIAPIYYVSGNHEFWSNEIRVIKDKIRKFNLDILENEYKKVTIKGIELTIGGVDDPDITRYENSKYDWKGEMISKFSALNNQTNYKILLAHRPEQIETYQQTSFDLVLSGHAHGGQVRIPYIINGLYSPNQGWFPKYSGGLYLHDTLTHIVSRGLSYNERLPRIFNPPEVVVIDLQGNK